MCKCFIHKQNGTRRQADRKRIIQVRHFSVHPRESWSTPTAVGKFCVSTSMFQKFLKSERNNKSIHDII